MFCKHCGTQMTDDSVFCPACGQAQGTARPVAPASVGGEEHHGYVDFFDAVKMSILNAIDFKSRASKSEFWWGYLFLSAASSILACIPYIGGFLSAATVLPSVSLLVRRFHDVGMPWQQVFKVLIPFYGIYFMIVTCLLPSTGDNEHGPGPRA